jgi:hypothetical protein
MAAQTASLFRVFDSLRSVVRFRRFELDPTKRRLTRVANVEDLRAVARRRLPRGVFDYIDGAAEDEITLAANSDAYRRVRFRPRVLRDVREVDPATTLLGRPVSLPLVIAPTGFTRIAHSAGELALARARLAGHLLPASAAQVFDDKQLHSIRSVIQQVGWHPEFTAKPAHRKRPAQPDVFSRWNGIQNRNPLLVVQQHAQAESCVGDQVPEFKSNDDGCFQCDWFQ